MPDDGRRLRARRGRKRTGTDFETSYLESLAAEKTASLTELQNATTWGLTIITTGTLFVLGRNDFPDALSLLGLLVLTVLSVHFATRTAKGYINVVRWSLIQRTLLSHLVNQDVDPETYRQTIRNYHIGWSLPLRRRDVAWKALAELGFGYLLILLLGAVIYCFMELPARVPHYLALAGAVTLIVFDVLIFVRSPYMQRTTPHAEARRLR